MQKKDVTEEIFETDINTSNAGSNLHDSILVKTIRAIVDITRIWLTQFTEVKYGLLGQNHYT